MEYLMELFINLDIDIVEFIDIKLIIALIAMGFCIKHIPCFKKFSNEYIPVILMITAIVVNVVTLNVFNTNSVMNAFVNSLLTAAISIGIHQQGKGFMKSFKAAGQSAVDTFVSTIDNDNEDEI